MTTQGTSAFGNFSVLTVRPQSVSRPDGLEPSFLYPK